jgi:hypothetical protein
VGFRSTKRGQPAGTFARDQGFEPRANDRRFLRQSRQPARPLDELFIENQSRAHLY